MKKLDSDQPKLLSLKSISLLLFFLIVRLFAYSQTICTLPYKPVAPFIQVIGLDTVFCVNRSQVDSINFTYEKLKVYKEQNKKLESLLNHCEEIKAIDLKIIAEMEQLDKDRVLEVAKYQKLNSNLIKKHKLELRQQKIKSIKKIVVVGLIGVGIGFLLKLVL